MHMSSDNPDNKDREEPKEPSQQFKLVPLALELGFSIAIPIVIFTLLGRFVDTKLETSPIFLVAGVVLSTFVTTFIVWRKVKKFLD